MQCSEIREILSAYIDEVLDDLEKKEVENHIRTCSQCLQELTDLQKTVQLLQSLGEVTPPEGFRDAWREKLAKEPKPVGGVISRAKLKLGQILSGHKRQLVAAVIIVGLGIGAGVYSLQERMVPQNQSNIALDTRSTDKPNAYSSKADDSNNPAGAPDTGVSSGAGEPADNISDTAKMKLYQDTVSPESIKQSENTATPESSTAAKTTINGRENKKSGPAAAGGAQPKSGENAGSAADTRSQEPIAANPVNPETMNSGPAGVERVNSGSAGVETVNPGIGASVTPSDEIRSMVRQEAYEGNHVESNSGQAPAGEQPRANLAVVPSDTQAAGTSSEPAATLQARTVERKPNTSLQKDVQKNNDSADALKQSSGSQSGNQSAKEPPAGNQEPSAGDQEAPKFGPETAQVDTSSAGTKIVRDGLITLEVKNYQNFSARLPALVQQYGGYIETSAENAGDAKNGSFVIRVPYGNFSELVARIESLGNVQGKQLSGRDVTDELIDAQARLRNLQKQEQSLLALMDKAGGVNDLLSVENELARVRGEIEALQGKLKNIDNAVIYSTLRLEVKEVVKPRVEPAKGTFAKAAENFKDSLVKMVNLISSLVSMAGWILPWALVLSAVGAAAYFYLKRK